MSQGIRYPTRLVRLSCEPELTRTLTLRLIYYIVYSIVLDSTYGPFTKEDNSEAEDNEEEEDEKEDSGEETPSREESDDIPDHTDPESDEFYEKGDVQGDDDDAVL